MISSGWVIVIPIVLPNLLLIALPARATTAPAEPPRRGRTRVLGIVEGAGRVAVFALPFFLSLRVATPVDLVCLAIAGAAAVLYYVGWARFFVRGRTPSLLFASLGRVQVPLAVAPVIYFLAFAVIMRSPLYGLVVVAFGFAHVKLSLQPAHRS